MHNGAAVANGITVPIDANSAIRIYNNTGSIDVFGDLSGGAYTTVSPTTANSTTQDHYLV